MIQKHSTSKLAAELKFIFTKPNKNNCVLTLETKCEKWTIEYIQNENSLKPRHKQTDLEIYLIIYFW